MTAIGVNVSDRDRTYTWADLKPKKRAPLEVEYIKAQGEAERLWRQYADNVDYWLTYHMIDTMNEHEELCKQADLKAHMMYVKLNGVNVEDGE